MTLPIRRFIAAATQVGLANLGRLSTPLKVNLALTYWCQYRCKTCNIWKQKPENELSTDEVLKFVRQNPGIAWLDVTGGEIFLRKDIDEILQAIVSTWTQLAVLHFPTNGFLTDRIVATCEALSKRSGPMIVVTVSVDGKEELNDRIRGVAGGFKRQMETVRALRTLPGIRTVIGVTLSRHNVGHFEETVLACRDACPGLSPSDVHLNVAQVSSHYYGTLDTDAVTADSRELIEEVRGCRHLKGSPRSIFQWVETSYLEHLESYLRTGTTPMRCHSLRSSCFVDPWGGVFPCITFSRPLGSLRDTAMDLGPIWHSEQAIAVQKDIWDGSCPNCWTACEAYQSILGNLFRRDTPSPKPRDVLIPLTKTDERHQS